MDVGWHWKTGARKRHFFNRDNQSLCKKHFVSPLETYFLNRYHDIPENCKECMKLREALPKEETRPLLYMLSG